MQNETDDSVHQKNIIKMKMKIDELRKENMRLEEKVKRLERERNRSSLESRSSQTTHGRRQDEESNYDRGSNQNYYQEGGSSYNEGF